MLTFIDDRLNSITMYRLVLYGLMVLLGISLFFAFLGLFPFSGPALLVTIGLILGVCLGSNWILAKLYKAPVNVESSYITALILSLLYVPPQDVAEAVILAVISFVAMAAKYVVTFRGKHIVNPAAFAVVLGAVTGLAYAEWWVGSAILLPFTALLGFAISRKLRRPAPIVAFFVTVLAVTAVLSLSNGIPVAEAIAELFTSWPLLFFAGVMLTEPITMPSGRNLQIGYGALVGALFASSWHVGPLYSSPEAALVIGNIVAFVFHPHGRTALRLRKKVEMGGGVYDFIFTPNRPLQFQPGQYAEWTLAHGHPDNRGTRRYFTLASSPTESEVHLGIKYLEPASSFKKALVALQPDELLYVGKADGQFTLPADSTQKLLLLAGGVGITPFRSFLKYLVDSQSRRDVVLLYSVNKAEELAYAKLLKEAEADGIRIVIIVRDEGTTQFSTKMGLVGAELIQEVVPDYLERCAYISGTPGYVKFCEKSLRSLGLTRRSIRKDYFPGY